MGDELRPGIVHRIDKNTSGLIIIAKIKSFKICQLSLKTTNIKSLSIINLGKIETISG